ncbi:hypothetical protein FACS189430_03100 [Bacteroidia bacterium]|nr:hypothetical protein FACS189430_03100 [Bacteroidia bacterium]
MKYTKILIFGFLCIQLNLQAQNLKMPSDIMNALETGNSKGFYNRFNSSIELLMNQNQNVYGKSQAEKILKIFFDANGPNFKYKGLHSSGKDLSNCNFIGQLFTSKGTYRVSIYIKNEQIYQMRLESND